MDELTAKDVERAVEVIEALAKLQYASLMMLLHDTTLDYSQEDAILAALASYTRHVR
jgi:hypothetical protein